MAQQALVPFFMFVGAMAYYQIELFGWLMFAWLLILINRSL
jgi:hypothetical protein